MYFKAEFPKRPLLQNSLQNHSLTVVTACINRVFSVLSALLLLQMQSINFLSLEACLTLTFRSSFGQSSDSIMHYYGLYRECGMVSGKYIKYTNVWVRCIEWLILALNLRQLCPNYMLTTVTYYVEGSMKAVDSEAV